MAVRWPWKRRELKEAWGWPHIFWVNVFGWWGDLSTTEQGRRWLPRLRVVTLTYILVFSLSLFTAIGEKLAKGDIMTNMFTLFASGPGIVGIFKVFQVVRLRKSLKAVMDQLDEMLDKVKNQEDEKIIRNGIMRSWIVFTIALTTGSSITFHWLSRPLMMAAMAGEKSRIVDTWPEFIDTWTDFVLTYLFQCPGVIVLGHAFYIFDNIYFCMAQMILTHLALLRYKLERLRLSSGEGRSQELITCIQYHDSILRTCKTLQDASAPVIIWQCINTVVMCCSGVFIFTMVKMNATTLLNLGELVLIVAVTFYCYCWYSNEMTLQLADVLGWSYVAEWADGSEGDKRSLHIMMTRCIKPVYFGGLLEIDLATYITVLKTTFSYYNFLLAVNGSDT